MTNSNNTTDPWPIIFPLGSVKYYTIHVDLAEERRQERRMRFNNQNTRRNLPKETQNDY